MPAHMIFHWQEFVVLLFTAAIIWLVLWVVFSFKKRFLSSEQKKSGVAKFTESAAGTGSGTGISQITPNRTGSKLRY